MNVLVIAPHPDDETLGCGATLMKHQRLGHKCHWLIVTAAFENQGFDNNWLIKRANEIQAISSFYGFSSVTELKHPSANLDLIPKRELVSQFSEIVNVIQANVVYVPFWGDVHSDHEIVFEAAASSTKNFRTPFIKSVRAYETLSETEFGLRSDSKFNPNMFVDIEEFLDRKVEAMSLYESEFMTGVGPRSERMIRALAAYRGCVIGSNAAEAFVSLKEVL